MTVTNLAQVSQQINDAIANKVYAVAENVNRRIVEETYQLVITDAATVGFGYGSPVLTGRFYTSHVVTVNYVDTSVQPANPGGSNAPYPPLTVQDATQAVKNWQIGDTTYITNSLDYADAIENRGVSYKTPNGVYSIAAENVKQRAKDLVLQAVAGL